MVPGPAKTGRGGACGFLEKRPVIPTSRELGVRAIGRQHAVVGAAAVHGEAGAAAGVNRVGVTRAAEHGEAGAAAGQDRTVIPPAPKPPQPHTTLAHLPILLAHSAHPPKLPP